MNPEQLSDAMNELPQELLEETQAARSRRRLRWKPLAAAAACLLLAAGAWALAGRPAEPTPAPAGVDIPGKQTDRHPSCRILHGQPGRISSEHHILMGAVRKLHPHGFCVKRCPFLVQIPQHRVVAVAADNGSCSAGPLVPDCNFQFRHVHHLPSHISTHCRELYTALPVCLRRSGRFCTAEGAAAHASFPTSPCPEKRII